MHELSIAVSIVEMASQEVAKRGGGRVCALHLRLGALSGVVKEALLFSHDIACLGTPLAGSKLIIEEVPVVIYCQTCQAEHNLESIQRFACPACGEPTAEVRQGKDLEVVALEIEDAVEERLT